MPTIYVLAALCLLNKYFVSSKTVYGVLSTLEARKYTGQFVTTFCSHGQNAVIKTELNATGSLSPKLYLFFHEDWAVAKRSPSCKEKFEVARNVFPLKSVHENSSVVAMTSPRCWHLVYADDATCDDSTEKFCQYWKGDIDFYHYVAARRFQGDMYSEDVQTSHQRHLLDFLKYTIVLLNPDVYGNPTVHFGDDESELFRFYQVLSLVYFVLGCIFGPTMYDSLQKEGPMHLVLQLLTAVMGLQAGSSLLIMMHLKGYSKDGVGSPLFEILSECLDLCSQFVMLYMMLSLCLGRTLGGIYKPLKSFSKLTEQTATQIVSVLAIFQGMLFIWEQYEERHTRHYHAHRSLIGILLAVIRTLLAALISAHLYQHLSTERSTMKRDFYLIFTKCCMLWFLCYPACVGASWLVAFHLRYKLVTMGVVVCQCVAAALLYRLFLSRSLYWELSSLSSSLLPLKMDKSLTVKLHS